MSTARCQHCGGNLIVVPVDDGRLRDVHETTCLLCGRAPAYVEPGPPSVRQMPPVCSQGHPSERYGYWSEHGQTRYRCARCEANRAKQLQAAGRAGHEAGRRAGWRIEGQGGLKRRVE